MGCASQDNPQKIYSAGSLKFWIVSYRSSPREHCATQKFGRERVHPKESCKNVNWSEFRGLQNLRIEHFRKLCNKDDAHTENHGIWRNMSISSKMRTRPRSTLLPKLGYCWYPLRRNQMREFVVDSRALMHMLSKKDLSSGERKTLRRSRNHPQR